MLIGTTDGISTEARWLSACAALAAGEGVAALAPRGAELWPALALAALLSFLFGYGLAVRGQRFVVLFLTGMALFYGASVGVERTYRERPWLRQCRSRAAASAESGALRREVSRRIGLGLGHDPETANLNRAILLGERSRLPRQVKRVFVESGTMHVFAISGLHVMLVARILLVLTCALLVPLRWAGLVALVPLWGYVVLVGCPPSAVRAALMASFYFAAPAFWRRPNGVMAWALTFFVVYLGAPRMITDVGCVLSFAVMLAIVLAGRQVRHLRDGWRLALWVTFAAWAAGVPIAAHVFGRVTPGGLLANLPLLCAAQYAVVAGFLGVLSSVVSETLAAHLNNFSALFTRGMVGLSEVVSRLPGANLETGKWTLVQCAEWYALLFLVLYLVRSVRSRHMV